MFDRDLTLNRQLSNRQNEARALNALGVLEDWRRKFDKATNYYQEALNIRLLIGDRAGVGASKLNLAQLLSKKGDYGQAEPLLLEALKIQQEINNRWWEVLIWNELGILYLMVGDLTKAEICLQQGLQLSRESDNHQGQAYVLCNLGQVLRERGDLEQAEQALTSGLALAKAQGDIQLEAIYYSDLAIVSLLKKRYSESIQQSNLSLEQFRSLGILLATTTNLTTLAAAHLEIGKKSQATRYVREAMKILDECNGEGPDFPHRDYWICYQVLQAVGETALAQHGLQSAWRLLMAQAAKISNPAMYKTYLENITCNVDIIHTAGMHGFSS